MKRSLSISLWLIWSIVLSAPRLAGASGMYLDVAFSPNAIVAGDSTTFSWNLVAPYGDCTIGGVPGISFGGLSGAITISPATSLTADVYCEAGPSPDTVGTYSFSGSASLDVEPVPQPPTVSASFASATVVRGNNATLNWTSQWATTCTSPEVPGVSGPAGSTIVTPQVTGSFTANISCSGVAGTGTTTATITVLPRGRPQVVIFPGTGGTRLEAIDGSGPVWVDASVLNILGPRDWNYFFQALAMKSAPTPEDPGALQPAFGQGVRAVSDGYLNDGLNGTACITDYVLGVCFQPYLGGTVDANGGHLADALWQSGIDLTVVNYDWRMRWEDHYAAIRQAFDAAYARGEGERVYVVGHSQGTQLARRFLQDNPDYQAMVALNFAIGAPNLGSPVATTANSSFTGGIDFGMGSYPIFLSKMTGLYIGDHLPSSYYSNPSKEFLRILHYNTGRWLYEQFVNGVRVQPQVDSPEGAQQAMRAMSAAPALFDAGVRVQDEMAAYQNNVPTYEIIADDAAQPTSWRIRATNWQYVVDVGEIPSDGTIPTISSLGRYCGCIHLGTLVIPLVDPHSDHQHLVDSTYAQAFITRAILRDRGAADANFATDFPLQSDEEILAHIGWSLPAPGEFGAMTPKAHMLAKTVAAAATPANRVEFTTRDVDAQLTITIADANAGTARQYRADKTGILLTSAFGDNTQVDHLNFGLAESPAPALNATTRSLFRSNFEVDDGGTPPPSGAGAADLDSITVRLPLPSNNCQISLTADRSISGVARVMRQDLAAASWAQLTDAINLAPGTNLRYTFDSLQPAAGTLYLEAGGSSTPLPLADDPDFTP